MWLSWRRRSPGKVHTLSRKNFSCSSFKDIENLCEKEHDHQSHSKKPSIFHRVRFATSKLRSWSFPSSNQATINLSEPLISSPDSEKRIVIYYTSLRIVRKTYEDCKTVRAIFRGLRVSTDERDLAMDSGILKELKGILGKKKELPLPRVFIGGRYYGGVEEIKQLNETGELKKIIEGFPLVESGVCDGCGGFRFVLCDQCDGSHKCYTDKSRDFQSCLYCNENGLIRCPSCYSVPH